MLGLWQRYSRIVTGVLLILIPTLIFSVSAEAERDSNIAARTVGLGQFASVSLVASIGDLISRPFSSQKDEEIEHLHAEIAQLKEERTRLIGVLQENARLRKLVDFKDQRPEYELSPARVIGRDVTPYFNVASIRLTSEAELDVGMPVISAEGVVGSIENVSGDYAKVRLLTDPRSRIDAVSERNRTRAIVAGFARDGILSARIAHLSSRDQVRAGDVLVTSGMAGRFPKELILGTITSVGKEDDSSAEYIVELEPATDFGRLNEVFVVTGDR